MGCFKQNLRVLLDVSLYNGPSAWPMCNTSVQLLYKVLHKLYNFSLCFRIQASIYADMAAYISIKEIDITHYISRYGVCQLN